LYEQWFARLLQLLEQQANRRLGLGSVMTEVLSGRIFGLPRLLSSAAHALRQASTASPRPVVMVVGEIYVRCNAFANDDVIAKLEQRGLQARLASFTEWIDYVEVLGRVSRDQAGLAPRVKRLLQDRIRKELHHALSTGSGASTEAPGTHQVFEAAQPYLPPQLEGEAILTLGAPLVAWRQHQVDGILNLAPHECMPGKIAEAQLHHAREQEGLPSLTLPLNGDPIDARILDQFAFDLHQAGHRARR
jgi:predicted nucleotide-binding protein (sugar kinase/HSP70/actin superfamily)